MRLAIASLQASLQSAADPQLKAWWEGYVKGSAPFLGVKMAQVRTAVHRWREAEVAGQYDDAQQLELALSLLEERYTEEKLAGILYLQELLLPAGVLQGDQILPRFATLFPAGAIHDWNVCDWFCVKVLGPMIQAYGMPCARPIASWHTASNLWQARASLVPFVQVAEDNTYYPLIQEAGLTLIGREERFAKTAVGWILREVSRHDPAFASRFIEGNLPHFTRESLKNATKYLPVGTRQRLARRL